MNTNLINVESQESRQVSEKSLNIESQNRYFKGIDTSSGTIENIKAYDLDLIKHDMILYFHTRKGSRVMYPNYGTTIYDKLFEPFNQTILEEIRQEVIQAINLDPRLRLIDLKVNVEEMGKKITVEALCEFLPSKNIDIIFTEFLINSSISTGFINS